MVVSTFKIPGHTDTSFKHRKAFILIKNYNNKNISYNRGQRQNFNIHPKLAPKNYQEKIHSSWRQKQIHFILLLAFIVMVFYGISAIYNMPPESHGTQSIYLERYEQRQRQNAYRVLVYSGKIYLRGNQLQQAHDEFVRALMIDPYGKEARIEITKLLLIICEFQGNHCQLAIDNIQFLEEMNYVTSEFSAFKNCMTGSSVFLEN